MTNIKTIFIFKRSRLVAVELKMFHVNSKRRIESEKLLFSLPNTSAGCLGFVDFILELSSQIKVCGVIVYCATSGVIVLR